MRGLSSFLEGSTTSQPGGASSFDTSCCSPLKARIRQHFVVDGSVVKLSVSDSDILGSRSAPVFVQCVGPVTTPPVRPPERRGVRRLHSNDRSTIAPLVLSSVGSNDDDYTSNKNNNSSTSFYLCSSPMPQSARRRILRPSSPQRKRRMEQLKQKRSQEQEHNQQLKARNQGTSTRERFLGSDALQNIANHRQEIASMRPHQRKIRWNMSLPQQRSPLSSRIQALQLEDLSLHVRTKRATTTTTTTSSKAKDDLTSKVTTHVEDSINEPGPQAAAVSKNKPDLSPQVTGNLRNKINRPLPQTAAKSMDNETTSNTPLETAENTHKQISVPCSQTAECVCDDSQYVDTLKNKIDKLTESLQKIRRQTKQDEHVNKHIQKKNTEIRQELANTSPVCSLSVAKLPQTIETLQLRTSQVNKQAILLNEQKSNSKQKANNSSKSPSIKSPIKSKCNIDTAVCYSGSENKRQKDSSNSKGVQDQVKFDDSYSNESSMPLLQLRSDRTSPTEETGASRYHFDLFVPPL